jgi:hypothetical protein
MRGFVHMEESGTINLVIRKREMEFGLEIWVGILTAGVTGLVKWINVLQRKIEETRLDLAKNYHGKDDLRRVIEDAVSPLMKSIVRLERTIDRLLPGKDGE